MLHHAVKSRDRGLHHVHPRHHSVRLNSTGVVERRQSDRIPFPAEMVVVWNHDMDATHACRFRMIDAGDCGYRIHSETALTEGMTGIVLRILPDRGRSLEQSVQVAWTRPCVSGVGFEAGLRRL